MKAGSLKRKAKRLRVPTAHRLKSYVCYLGPRSHVGLAIARTENAMRGVRMKVQMPKEALGVIRARSMAMRGANEVSRSITDFDSTRCYPPHINRTAKTSSTYAAHAVNVSRAPPPGAAAVPRARREGRHRRGRARAVCNRVAFSKRCPPRRGVEPVPLTASVS